jgi:hypothetical protein
MTSRTGPSAINGFLIHINGAHFINETMEMLKMGDNRYADFPGRKALRARHNE